MTTQDPPSPGTPGDADPSGGGATPGSYSGGSMPPPPPYGGDRPVPGREPRNGMGLAGLVCGIVAVGLSLIPGLNLFTWPLGVLAIIFGAVGWSRANKGEATNRKAAIAGLVLGIVSFFTLCLIYVLIGAGGNSYYDAAPPL